ncbi:unnamed protein product, partial [Iphiclides podalirius]
MLSRDAAWRAVTSFFETVIVKKEAAERDRERTDPSRRRGHRDEGTPRYGPPYIKGVPLPETGPQGSRATGPL